MALRFDLSAISRDITHPLVRDPEELAYLRKYGREMGVEFVDNGDDDCRRLSSVTQAIIFATMSIGMNRITDRNWAEFFSRVYAVEQLRGAGQKGIGKDGKQLDVYLQPLDIRAHIGLRTNAATLTTTQFWKKVREAVEQDAATAVANLGA